jgi:GDP-4-dehydro-6-deoxy-D-mannose reductase
VRVLITGVTGFAGGHLAALCAGLGHEVHGLVRPGREDAAPPAVRAHAAQLTDPESVRALLAEVAPDRVIHLAGASSVGRSFGAPIETWTANLWGTLGLLEALRLEGGGGVGGCLVVSSGEVYGRVPLEALPVGPDTPMRPLSPYGAAKAAADLAALQYREGYGLPIVVVRAFNQIGPGQDERFVLPSAARQIAEAERRGDERAVIRIGNVDVRRDFIDVRDMARAYWLLTERAPADGVHLACTGHSISVRELLERLAAHARRPVVYEGDPERVREGEQPDLYGTPSPYLAEAGWRPEIPLERSLADTLDYWRQRLSRGG